MSINESCPIINTSRMLWGIFQAWRLKFYRFLGDNEIIIPSGQVEIYPGDDIYLYKE